jgi:hypothetical protein
MNMRDLTETECLWILVIILSIVILATFFFATERPAKWHIKEDEREKRRDEFRKLN